MILQQEEKKKKIIANNSQMPVVSLRSQNPPLPFPAAGPPTGKKKTKVVKTHHHLTHTPVLKLINKPNTARPTKPTTSSSRPN
jgi:hypothetical protein